ncbi:outer membrane protein assembly factor BamB family protein [Lignipirellula cremea]|nr:PQQ-binding-like beta-propeller repeat protein [Lignipirellula cremea]
MTQRSLSRPSCLVFAILLALQSSGRGDDWRLAWKRDLPERAPAWRHTQRMTMDVGYSPVAANGMVFVGCEHNSALLALDGQTGEERWRFFTAAPIRHAPAADDMRVYAGSDDGYLYCINRAGALVWKIRGGPAARLVIGHERIISAWPISTRPLLADGVLYFVAGYWPVDGIFVHAVEAATGKSIWVHDSAELRPNRQLTLVDGKLMVDGDNSSAVLDAKTGVLLKEKPIKSPAVERPQVSGVQGNMSGWSQFGDVLAVGSTTGVFGFSKQAVQNVDAQHVEQDESPAIDTSLAKAILVRAGVAQGYCLVAGLNDGALVAGLLRESKLHVVAFDPDESKVARIRRALDGRGLFDDHRLCVLVGRPEEIGLPPYFASLIVSESDHALAEAARESLRPYGGALVSHNKGAAITIALRDGPPAGAADWTHEFRDAANSLASPDALVKAPLGLLWYGGEAAHARFYFDGNVDHQSGHGLNPQPVPAQIVEGRMILQGPGLLAAVDIYTGRVLWESPLPTMYTFGGAGGGLGIHSKKHPKPWEYEEALKFEVAPTERCRASGFDCVSQPDGIYIAAGKELLRFDPTSGELLSRQPAPIDGDLRWGSVRISGDTLLATLFRPQDIADAQAGFDGNGGDWGGDRMPMSHLVALDRHSGKLLWSRQANWGFLNRSGICVGGGNVYCVDLITDKIYDKLKEAGRKFPTSPPTLYALDLTTGKESWQFPLDVYVQNIVYCQSRDLLLAPCRNLKEWRDGRWVDLSIDIRRGVRDKKAAGNMRALRGKDGSVAWEVADAAYHSPHIVLGDLIIDRYGVTYDLASGERHLRMSPETGKEEIWSFKKGGCNHLIACENLVTWRCAYYDLASHSGVKSLTGMDAGCSPTLIPAGGVLNIPNFGTHHKRNRMTAMALVHRPAE